MKLSDFFKIKHLGFPIECSHLLRFLKMRDISEEMRDLNTIHIIEWLRQLAAERQDIMKFMKSVRFRLLITGILSESKYWMAYLTTLGKIERLVFCKTFDSTVFSKLFDLFWKSAQKVCNDPKGKELISNLPELVPENGEGLDSWFKTLINDCFRLNSVVDCYLWMSDNGINTDLDQRDQVIRMVRMYEDSVKTKTKGARKKTQVFLNGLLEYYGAYSPPAKNTDKLSPEVISIIDQFIAFKKQGGVIYNGPTLVSNRRWSPGGAVYSRAFIIRFIKNVLETRNDCMSFTIFSLAMDDFLAASQKMKFSSKSDLNKIRQFIAWLIERPDCPEKSKSALKHLYNLLPRETEENIPKGIQIGRNWLSRAEFVTLIHLCLLDFEELFRLRNAVLVCLCGFAALRRREACLAQVGDFILDQNNLLADMGNGYGKLIWPAYKSKAGKAPSIPPYHIAIVPRFRNLINKYLTESPLMTGYTKETFLIRTVPADEIDPLFENPNYKDGDWLKSVSARGSHIMTSIWNKFAPVIDGKVTGTVGTHDLRRTINGFIDDSIILSQFVPRVREIHLRHTGERSVNKDHYLNPNVPSVDPLHHLMIIDSTLNFPWDLKKLEDWEETKVVKRREIIQGEEKYPTLPREKKSEASLSEPGKILVPHTPPLPVLTKRERLNKEISDLQQQLKEDKANKIMLTAKISKLQKELDLLTDI